MSESLLEDNSKQNMTKAETSPSDVVVNMSKDLFEQECGYSYDYVLVFKVHEENVDLSPLQKEYSMRNILQRLASGGLENKMFYSVKRDEVYCKIRASLERLAKEADRIDYKLELDANELRKRAEQGNKERNIAPISITDPMNVSHRNPYEFIFAKYDMDDSLQCLYKKYGPRRIPFRGADRLKLISSILSTSVSNGGCGLHLFNLIHSECILAAYPLHQEEEKLSLRANWINWHAMPWQQPLTQIKNYYGEKIGLYFAWLGHYTTWLIAPSIVGCFVMINIVMEKAVDAHAVPYFGLFMALWSTLYLEYWKRRNATLALEWGMNGFEDEEQDRPEFEGDETTSPIDGSPMRYFDPKKQMHRVLTGLLLIFFLLLVVVVAVAGIFAFRYFFKKSDSSDLGHIFVIMGKDISGPVASTLNAIQIQVMGGIYQAFAVRLNNWENHRTDTEYEDSLITKTFLFQFVNNYASCFYIAFLKNLIGDGCGEHCMSELCLSLGIIFGLRITSGNFSEVVLPYLKRKWNERKESKEADNDRIMSSAEEQFFLHTYDAMGTFDDYAEMVIQFGYATLFVVGFPLAPVLALANNYLEIRIDAYKLTNESRRPDPRGGEDIGTWYTILEIMANVSVMTNVAIVIFTSHRVTSGLDLEWKFLLFLVAEHTLLLLKFILSILVDDEPHDVQIQKSRAEFLVSKVILCVADDDESMLLQGNKVRVDLTVFDDDC